MVKCFGHFIYIYIYIYIYIFVISSFGKGLFGHFLDKNILFMEKVGCCVRLQSVVIKCVFINEKQLGSGGLSSISLSSPWKTSRVSYHLFFISNLIFILLISICFVVYLLLIFFFNFIPQHLI